MIESKDDVKLFQKILFQPCDDAQVQKLTEDQKQHFRLALAQKIAFEAVYKKSYPQEDTELPENQYHTPNISSYICCCFYPEYYQNSFELTSDLFKRRVLGTFVFWRDDFLEIIDQAKEDKPEKGPDLYGPLWLSLTYIILLGICANLNDYFSFGAKPTVFTFQTDYLSTAVGLNILFRFCEIFVYPAIIGCLDGEFSALESAYLVGYSLILYFIPTMICVLPIKNAHMTALLIAALLRAIFLGRNYTSRLLDKKGILFIVIIGVEILHFYVMQNAFFDNYSNNQHYLHKPTVIPAKTNATKVAAAAAPKAAAKIAHRLFLDTGISF